ncbi:hypothetical protein AB0B45_02335 [Nonomuraea sp. NPDC049152]|uniref:hypothetical protein n=1 Tax=Nonomuraea sp. NPDC049152 TaxID=3154350 RepID=UPI0033C40C18
MSAELNVDLELVITNLRQQHAQQIDELTYRVALLSAAVDQLRADNQRLREAEQERA